MHCGGARVRYAACTTIIPEFPCDGTLLIYRVAMDTNKKIVNMAAQKQKEKEPVNIVHQNAIFRETIHKEQRHQKLYTSYGVNPYKKSK